MALEFGNRIAVSTSTTGTGTVTLGSAVSDAFMTFSEGGITDGATVHYLITEGNDFEIGTGTYTSSGTTLSRDTVTDSKISGTAGTTKMTLGGSAEVRVIADASDFGGGGGGLVFIATADLSNDATANFTGFDSGSYDAYKFVLQNVIPSQDSVTLQIRTTSDGGLNWDNGASDYRWSRFDDYGSGSGSARDMADDSIELIASIGSAANEDGASGYVLIMSPHLAKNTHFVWNINGDHSSGNQIWSVGGGARVSTTAVNGVQFSYNSNNLESGTITMYGIVNA